jgi:transcriptional regulator with PAS, ATPase and Fis domain
VLTINLPPLRKRSGDIKCLANYFIRTFNRLYRKKLDLSPDTYELLSKYTWPGNVRELMYFIERLVIIAKENPVSGDTAMKYFEDREYETASPVTTDFSALSEKKQIIAALADSNANIKQAAQLLGMDRSTLYRKLRTYKIETKKTY